MDWKGLAIGLRSTFIASSCCSFPLALVVAFGALGVGSVGAALRIPKYKAFFAAAGTVFLAASLYMTIRNRSGGVCRLRDVWRERALVAASVLSYVVLTTFMIYWVLPWVSEIIF